MTYNKAGFLVITFAACVSRISCHGFVDRFSETVSETWPRISLNISSLDVIRKSTSIFVYVLATECLRHVPVGATALLDGNV